MRRTARAPPTRCRAAVKTFRIRRYVSQAEDFLTLEAHRLLAAGGDVEPRRVLELVQDRAPLGVLVHRDEDFLQAVDELRVHFLAHRDEMAREIFRLAEDDEVGLFLRVEPVEVLVAERAGGGSA